MPEKGYIPPEEVEEMLVEETLRQAAELESRGFEADAGAEMTISASLRSKVHRRTQCEWEIRLGDVVRLLCTLHPGLPDATRVQASLRKVGVKQRELDPVDPSEKLVFTWEE